MYTTKGSIMVELMDIGMEKIQQAGSLEGIVKLLEERGLKVTPQQVAETIQVAARLGRR